MPERVPCEFFLVRYVPDVVKGEFVNIGVLLREAAPLPGRAAEHRVRFTRDWTRVRCIDRGADIGLLEDLEQEIGLRLKTAVTAHEPRPMLDVLEDTLSNSIQMTPPRASLAENLTTELEQLMRLYVEPLASPEVQSARSKKTGRPALLTAMRTAFERAGVWTLMNKRIAAEPYTRKGDPFRFDCGYRKTLASDQGVRIFQAVSLASDVEMARGLAYTAPRLREGIRQQEKVDLELTAMIEPRPSISPKQDGIEDEAQQRYRFGIEIMEQCGITVSTLSQLAGIAESAKYDLGL